MNRNTGEITYQQNPRMLGFTQSTGCAILCIPKGKYNHWTRHHMPKTMKLTGNTSEMLQHFEKIIDKWARLLNIQKLQSIKPSGREYHLITLMGLKGSRRKALWSAVAAGHSKETKARYYKKVSYEEAQESFGRHHTAFVEGG